MYKKNKDPGRDSRLKEQHVQSHGVTKGHSTFENGRKLTVVLAQGA